MSIRHEDEMTRAKTIGMSWMILSILGSLAVGFFGFAYVVSEGVDLSDSEKIFITLSQLMFNPWIAGFLLAAILAAIMSTIDSQLLVSSSVLTRDIYHVLFRKNASDRELVWVGRGTVIAIALIAWYLSTDQNSSVLKLVAYAWAGFGAAFGPLVILSLYSPRVTSLGAVSGMIAGSLTVIAWKQLEGGIFDLYELLPGFVAAWIAIVVFSALGEESSQRSRTIFDEVQNRLTKPE
jgi:sodium/proline symporter